MDPNSDRRARILLINPNSLEATTAMMVAIAKSSAADGFDIVGATATRGRTPASADVRRACDRADSVCHEADYSPHHSARRRLIFRLAGAAIDDRFLALDGCG